MGYNYVQRVFLSLRYRTDCDLSHFVEALACPLITLFTFHHYNSPSDCQLTESHPHYGAGFRIH